MTQMTEDEVLVLIQTALWIHEFFGWIFFITSLVSNVGGVGPWWRFTLSEYSRLFIILERFSTTFIRPAMLNNFLKRYVRFEEYIRLLY